MSEKRRRIVLILFTGERRAGGIHVAPTCYAAVARVHFTAGYEGALKRALTQRASRLTWLCCCC